MLELLCEIEWCVLDLVSFTSTCTTSSLGYGTKLLVDPGVHRIDRSLGVRILPSLKSCRWILSQCTRGLLLWYSSSLKKKRPLSGECAHSPDNSSECSEPGASGSMSYWIHSVTGRFHCSCWEWWRYLRGWDWEEQPSRTRLRKWIPNNRHCVWTQSYSGLRPNILDTWLKSGTQLVTIHALVVSGQVESLYI